MAQLFSGRFLSGHIRPDRSPLDVNGMAPPATDASPQRHQAGQLRLRSGIGRHHCNLRCYVYRAVDQHGQVIDVLVSAHRDGRRRPPVLPPGAGHLVSGACRAPMSADTTTIEISAVTVNAADNSTTCLALPRLPFPRISRLPQAHGASTGAYVIDSLGKGRSSNRIRTLAGSWTTASDSLPDPCGSAGEATSAPCRTTSRIIDASAGRL